MNDWIITAILLFAIVIVTTLLIVAYIITPIVGWLINNPLGGIALLITLIILIGILSYRELSK